MSLTRSRSISSSRVRCRRAGRHDPLRALELRQERRASLRVSTTGTFLGGGRARFGQGRPAVARALRRREKQGAQGLVLGGGLTAPWSMRETPPPRARPSPGVALAVKEDEAAHPAQYTSSVRRCCNTWRAASRGRGRAVWACWRGNCVCSGWDHEVFRIPRDLLAWTGFSAKTLQN